MKQRQLFCIIILTVVILLSTVGCGPVSFSYADGEGQATLVLVNGTLIDGTGADPIPDAVVLMAGNRIVAVGSSSTLKVPAGVQTIDVEGATILPGFINAHVHYGFDKANLQAWAYGGVTTVRDEGTNPDQVAGLETFRAEIEADPSYARLVSYGVMITVPEGYGDLFVSSPEEARQAVLDEITQGVNGIKVSQEDGYAGTSGLPKLTPEQLAAIVQTADENGFLVSGHITQGKYIQALINAGVDDIGHVPYDYFPPNVVQQLVEKGIYLTPTFTVFRSYGAPVGNCVRNLMQFIQAGGQVALGNDYGGGPGDFELGIPMYEVGMMSQAGMTPMQIIVASTKNAAHVSHIENEVGTLEPGKYADILIVGGDPLEDLQALIDVQMVIHNGVIIRDEIQQ